MYPGFGQSMFSQRQDKDPLSGMYGPGGGAAAGQPNLYGTAMPTASGLSGMQGISGLHQPPSNRAIGNNAQFVSRSNTAPGNYGSTNMGGMTQMGAPSPPAGRAGMMTLGSGRASLMSTGQGLVTPKPRPSTLSSAIGSAVPVNAFSALGGRSQGIMSPISSGYNSAFSETMGQPGFDSVEFPMLSLGRGRQDNIASGLMTSSNALARQGFNNAGQLPVSRVESVPGFQMHSEDFPALPGTSKSNDSPAEVAQENKFPVMSTMGGTLPEYRLNLPYDPAPGANKERSDSHGLLHDFRGSNLSTPIGPPKTNTRKSYQPTTVSIPPGMVQDQFGMMGLLTFIRGAETDPSLVALALGSDLTTLGLNLNSPESLYNTFASPWADSPCRLQDIDYNVPQEYLIHAYVREKLAPIRLGKYHDDLLFYIYYCNGGDLMQTLAAAELYSRDWRYHKEERLWITRAPNMKPTKQENTYEEGTYCFFDVHSWRKAHKDFRVEYDKLEDRPQIPPNITPGVHYGITIPTPA